MESRLIFTSLVLTAVYAAELRVKPSDSTVTIGQPHTFECIIAGEYQRGKQHVYWAWTGPRNQQKFLSVDRTLYPAVDADKRSRYSITGNMNEGEFNLHISSTTADDQGQFRCIMYDSGRSARASAMLSVQELHLPHQGYPKCSITPTNPQPGEYATFSCISAGGNPPATLSWARRKKSDIPAHHNSTGQQTGAYLHRLLTGHDNNVTFTCFSRSAHSADFGSCTVVPFEIPTHVTIMPPQMVAVGDYAEFFCLATSVPSSIKYRWFVGKGQSMTKVTRTKGRFVLANEGASLRILNITQDDNGMPVQCVARNPLDIKGMDEDIVRVVVQRNPIPTVTTTKPLLRSTKATPTTSTPFVPPRTSRKTWMQTLTVQATEFQTPAPPKLPPLRTAPKRVPESPKPKNSAAIIPVTTNEVDEPVSPSPPLEDDTTRQPPDSVQQPGPNSKGFTAGAAVGFTMLILIVFVLIGILIKIKIVDKQEKPAERKTLRPAYKPRIDKLDIVVLPNTAQENDSNTSDVQRSSSDDAPRSKHKQNSVKSDKSPRRSSFVHPDFLEQLASTIRSKSHCSTMFKRGSISWRKRKASTLDRPSAVKSESSLAEEATSTVKRYSAFFNAVPKVPNEEVPVASPRNIQTPESVYENTEIGLKLQEEANRFSRESPYENTQYPMNDTALSSDPDNRKSEASSLLNLVYADLDWTGFPSRHEDVNDTEERTEYAAIRTSKVLDHSVMPPGHCCTRRAMVEVAVHGAGGGAWLNYGTIINKAPSQISTMVCSVLSSAVQLLVLMLISSGTISATSPLRENPTDAFTTPGSIVVLRCAVDNRPGQPEYNVYWYRHSPSNAYLTKGTRVFRQSFRSGTMWQRLSVIGDTSAGEYFLQIRDVGMEDAGEYGCVYFQGDRYLGESRIATITVYEPPDEGYPRCSMEPSGVNLEPGQKVVLTCISAGGDPRPRLDWMSWHEILPGRVQDDPPKATYELQLMETDNGAVFTCVENTPATPQLARTCSLKPFHRPTNVSIVTSPVHIGEDAVFSCTAAGIPIISNYTWTIAGQSPEKFTSASGEKVVVEGSNQILRIVNVLAEDNATIVKCYANNEVNEEGVASTEILIAQLLPSFPSGKNMSPRDNNDESGVNAGIVVGSVLILLILIVVIIILVRKLLCLNRKRAPSGEQDPEIQEAESQPLKTELDETPPPVVNIQSNPIHRPVTICLTPRDAIVEHIRETEEAGGEPIRPPDNTSRVTVVGRLSCAGLTVDVGDIAAMYSRPVKKTEAQKQADVVPDPEPKDSKPKPKPRPASKPPLLPKPKLLPKPGTPSPVKPKEELVSPKEEEQPEEDDEEVIYENTYRRPDITMDLGEESDSVNL
ncbi:uncharacterized protein LOC119721815 [Patiria miniata]|uniref:Ig-like domain-containing protein n=1 Tax=Patiria miniata TaxID=46514 RepID=A0A913Z7N8_PATMI|nr:uncharacterized protein LOC119721815 [Patiria miniata]